MNFKKLVKYLMGVTAFGGLIFYFTKNQNKQLINRQNNETSNNNQTINGNKNFPIINNRRINGNNNYQKNETNIKQNK